MSLVAVLLPSGSGLASPVLRWRSKHGARSVMVIRFTISVLMHPRQRWWMSCSKSWLGESLG